MNIQLNNVCEFVQKDSLDRMAEAQMVISLVIIMELQLRLRQINEYFENIFFYYIHMR